MRKRIFVTIVAALSMLSAAANTLYTHDGTVKQSYNFLFYTPDSYKPESETKLPLIVFLHGRSLSGTDLNRVRRYGSLSAIQYGRKIDALILAPQSPGEKWNPEKLNRLIDWTFENYDVDTNRVYVIGMSMGGYGTMDYVAAYPHRVTAAIAMCGGISSLNNAPKMKDVPLWIIHGTDDKAVPVAKSDEVFAKLNESGKPHQTHYDRLDSVNHAMLARMFYLNETYKWLFEHTQKGKKNTIRPTFDVRRLLPGAYKGLRSNSVTIKVEPGKPKPAPAPAVEQQDTLAKTAPTTATTAPTAPKDSTMSAEEAKRLAAEKAAREKAEKAAAAKLAAQKKAAAEAAAKKKAAEEAKKKAAEEAKKKAAEEAKKKAAEEAKKKAEAAKWHVVKSGESQWSIANKHGISVDQLRKMNKLTDKSVIQPGQKLRVKY